LVNYDMSCLNLFSRDITGQVQCISCVHETHDLQQYVELLDCHNIGSTGPKCALADHQTKK
jgi:hypothetical protein